jgi:hypothetical protein
MTSLPNNCPSAETICHHNRNAQDKIKDSDRYGARARARQGNSVHTRKLVVFAVSTQIVTTLCCQNDDKKSGE